MATMRNVTDVDHTTDIGKLQYLSCSAIRPNPNQPRTHFDENLLQELAESIDAQGLLQPITVRELDEPTEEGIRYELVSGERRLRAIRDILGKSLVKCVIVAKMSDSDSTIMALLENLQRSDLSAMEIAASLEKIQTALDLDYQALAKRTGKSVSWVKNMLRLLKLQPETKAAVGEGLLQASIAIQMVGIDREDQLNLTNKFIKEGASYAAATKAVKKYKEKAEAIDENKGDSSSKNKDKDENESKDEASINTKMLVLVECNSDAERKSLLAHLKEKSMKTWTGTSILDAIEGAMSKE